MIPPQELRIGNYVLWQGKIVEVISIMPRWACVRDDEVTFSRSYEEFQSVPITEEWLREFGFIGDVWLDKTFPDSSELGTITKMSYNNGIVFIKQKLLQGVTQSDASKIIIEYEEKFGPIEDDDKFGIPMLNNMVQIERRIKHVHTLQNLYFALTGEELKRKEFEPKEKEE